MAKTGKEWRKREREVMSRLGLTPVVGSGSGWISKEDGESETILSQLKSTEKDSYRITLYDLELLKEHARQAGKAPLFVVDFVGVGAFLLIQAGDFDEISDALYGRDIKTEDVRIAKVAEDSFVQRKTVSSSARARNKFNKEQEEKWQKKK
jgi:hypothetical protein